MNGTLTPCVCGCGKSASRLNARGHAWGCKGVECRNRRARTKGRDGQARMHRWLGGGRLRSSHEEAARPYLVRLFVESKVGAQVPKSFHDALNGQWFEDALAQAQEAQDDTPSGPDPSFPAVYIELSRSRRFLIVGGTAP